MPRDAEGVGGGPGMLAVAPKPKLAMTAMESAATVFFMLLPPVR
jgi:hypothetical protein